IHETGESGGDLSEHSLVPFLGLRKMIYILSQPWSILWIGLNLPLLGIFGPSPFGGRCHTPALNSSTVLGSARIVTALPNLPTKSVTTDLWMSATSYCRLECVLREATTYSSVLTPCIDCSAQHTK